MLFADLTTPKKFVVYILSSSDMKLSSRIGHRVVEKNVFKINYDETKNQICIAEFKMMKVLRKYNIILYSASI